MGPKNLMVGLVAVALLGGACGEGEDSSLAGTYNCGLEGQPNVEVWELREEGILTVTNLREPGAEPLEGTWIMRDGQVIINHPGADNDPFDVEDDRLVFAGPPGPEGNWICTRTS